MNINKSSKKEIIDFFGMDESGKASDKMTPILHLHLMGGSSQTDRGFKSNTGRGKAINAKTNKFDYLEMSRLVHSNECNIKIHNKKTLKL